MAYQVGDVVRISTDVPFTAVDTGATFDPVVVRFLIRHELDVVATVYQYNQDVEVIRDGPGDYHLDLALEREGRYYYRIEGKTGVNAAQGAAEGSLYTEVSPLV